MTINGHVIKPGADLRGVDLQGADLRGANLQDVNLQGANLRGANLRGAFRYTNLRGADLRGVDLQGADLRGANLQDVDLRGANLQDVDLQYANLRDADLGDADLRGANLTGTSLDSNAPIPYPSRKELIDKGFETVGEWVIGYRTKTSVYQREKGCITFIPGKKYHPKNYAPYVRGCIAKEDCQPGLFFYSTPDKLKTKYPQMEYVKVKTLRRYIVVAETKVRTLSYLHCIENL